MKLMVLLIPAVVLATILATDCEPRKRKTSQIVKKKVRNKSPSRPFPPVTVTPLEASIREDAYPQHYSHDYMEEVKIPVGKFFLGLPAFVAFLKILFFLNAQCSSATSCTTTLTTTSTSTAASTSTLTATSTSLSVPVAIDTSVSSTITTTSTTPVVPTTTTTSVVSVVPQTIVFTSSSTSVTSTTATARTTTTDVLVTTATSTSVTITTTRTMLRNLNKLPFFDYDSEDNPLGFLSNYPPVDRTALPLVDFVTTIPMTGNVDQYLVDRENSIDDDYWLLEGFIWPEKLGKGGREIESSMDVGRIKTQSFHFDLIKSTGV